MPLTTLLVYLALVVAVVMVWRGVWGLLDEYLLPKNPRLSYWISFIIGLVLLLILLPFAPRLT